MKTVKLKCKHEMNYVYYDLSYNGGPTIRWIISYDAWILKNKEMFPDFEEDEDHFPNMVDAQIASRIKNGLDFTNVGGVYENQVILTLFALMKEL